ncbi:hypothetical protein EZV62_010674 [Acer yangbiense]|uniref:Uncharacterized protein n=1 Tax=Acer yangbiense TaxID=1000413 RepID=A0A5C7I389_9ROSI|nr:hypothetical protein EZV62_010674 [Acer yangbiense]
MFYSGLAMYTPDDGTDQAHTGAQQSELESSLLGRADVHRLAIEVVQPLMILALTLEFGRFSKMAKKHLILRNQNVLLENYFFLSLFTFIFCLIIPFSGLLLAV